MILRPAFSADAAALATLGRESFVAAFGHLYASADLAAFLAEHKTEAAYARKLGDPGTSVAVIEDTDGLAGLCILGFPSEFADHSDASKPIALRQLYTAPDRTGEGVGARLMDWALKEARTAGADAMQLSVWSENLGAQRFYARYGFAKIADVDFWVGHHRDDEFLLELRLPPQGGQSFKR